MVQQSRLWVQYYLDSIDHFGVCFTFFSTKSFSVIIGFNADFAFVFDTQRVVFYLLVVSILFITTLPIIKQFGLIKSLLAMVVLVSVAVLVPL